MDDISIQSGYHDGDDVFGLEQDQGGRIQEGLRHDAMSFRNDGQIFVVIQRVLQLDLDVPWTVKVRDRVS